MAHLFISSEDSKMFYPDNNSYDFTIELVKTMRGRFRIALCEIDYTPSGEDLYIFCDACSQTQVMDRLLPLLRIVDTPGEFSTLYFRTVTRPLVQRLRVYIRNRDMEIPTADIGRVRCTLLIETI